MSEEIYTLLDAINEMIEDNNKKFQRIGDEEFIIYIGEFGHIQFKINDIEMILPINNYKYELWREV